MSVWICTDSSAQLGAEEAEAHGITVVPVGIGLDGGPFVDEAELDVDRFYDQLAAGAVASTSLPSPGRFAQAYAAVAAAGAQAIVSIHLDARVSGTVTAAGLAARTAAVPVTVIDAGTVSRGVGLAVLAAARALAGGLPASSVRSLVEVLGPQLRNVFVAAGAGGGRVPRRAGSPLFAFEQGAPFVVGECVGTAAALEGMTRLILADGPAACVAVGHSHRSTEAAADELARRLGEAGADVSRYRVGPSVGAHAGPFSFGVFWTRETISTAAASDPATVLESIPRRVA